MKSEKYCLVVIMAGFTLSCQNFNMEAHSRNLVDERKLGNRPAVQVSQSGESTTINLPIEDYIEQKLHRPRQEKDGRDFDEALIREKPKFRKMVAACFAEESQKKRPDISIQGDMRIVAELEKDIYLLQLTCGWGRGASIYSWFIYHPETGIQADVLKLSIASLNKSGKFTVREETSLFLRDFVYDAVKKEVTVSVPCHQADGHVASRTTYKYENRKLILAEYWQDASKNESCLQKPTFQRFYP
jgi:hypothetical protein